MSKRNRDKRKRLTACSQHNGKHAGKPLQMVRRVVITQAFQRSTSVEPWNEVSVNVDCGGMTEGDAAKLAYRAAVSVMDKLTKQAEVVKIAANDHGKPHQDNAAEVLGLRFKNDGAIDGHTEPLHAAGEAGTAGSVVGEVAQRTVEEGTASCCGRIEETKELADGC